MIRVPVFMHECAKNEKRLACESRYDFRAFIFLSTSDNATVDNNEDICGGGDQTIILP